MKENWESAEHISAPPPSDSIYWLTEVKKLGNELSNYFCDLKLKKLAHLHTKLKTHEQRLLNTTETEAFVRLISHHQNHRNIVLGRTVIPESTYRQYKSIFDNLDNVSIGDSFLFQKEGVNRSDFYLRQYSADEVNALFQDTSKVSSCVWARASVFCIDQKYKLIIEEFFLEFPPKRDD